MRYRSPYEAPDAGVPKNLAEIWDFLGSMVLGAPTFESELFPEQTLDSTFSALNRGFDLVREKVGEERYVRLIHLSRNAADLFSADQLDTSGQADEGREALFEMERIIREVQKAPKG